MHSQLISRKVFLLLLFYCFLFFCVFNVSKLFEKKTKIVFCDVGNGDATYIRVDNHTNLLVDAGPNSSTLSCLGKNMPLDERQIEYLYITSNRKSSYGGLPFILKRYTIRHLYIDMSGDVPSSLQKILDTAKRKNINIVDISRINTLPLVQINARVEAKKDKNISLTEVRLLSYNHSILFINYGRNIKQITEAIQAGKNVVYIRFSGKALPHSLNSLFLALADKYTIVINQPLSKAFSTQTSTLYKNVSILSTRDRGDIVRFFNLCK